LESGFGIPPLAHPELQLSRSFSLGAERNQDRQPLRSHRVDEPISAT